MSDLRTELDLIISSALANESIKTARSQALTSIIALINERYVEKDEVKKAFNSGYCQGTRLSRPTDYLTLQEAYEKALKAIKDWSDSITETTLIKDIPDYKIALRTAFGIQEKEGDK